MQSGARPQFSITTWRARGKPRIATIKDGGVLSLMQAVGRPVTGDPRMHAEMSGSCRGIFALPSGHVVELYGGAATDGVEVGYVFANLDAWLTHAQSVDR